MNELTHSLEQYALISLEKQEKLSRLLGDHLVELDFDMGLLRFSGEMEFYFHVLGTESDNTLTWLWAWADEQAEAPEELLQSALQMKEWGASRGIEECTLASVDLDKADGHALSLLAAEVCSASCYYRDAYDGGALFLLLFGKEIDRQPSFDAAGLVRRFSQLILLPNLNHRNALLAYLRKKLLPFVEHGAIITAELESGEDIRAEFDPSSRLLFINGKTLSLV